jgi:hypothetical protein
MAHFVEMIIEAGSHAITAERAGWSIWVKVVAGTTVTIVAGIALLFILDTSGYLKLLDMRTWF